MESYVEQDLENLNESADFWRYDIGVNVIPADTISKKPLVSWSEWQDKPLPEELHDSWKKKGLFSKGIAIVVGKIWHREDRNGLFLIFVDADKQNAVEELCTRNGKALTLQDVAKKFLVEQHEDNIEKAHIYFYSPIPFPKKPADSILGLEVKGSGEHGIAFCFPSIHKDGKPYEIIGTNQPVTLTTEQAMEMIQHLNHICIKYGLEYLEKDMPILKTLTIDSNIQIIQGERHLTLLSFADSLLLRHLNKTKTQKWLREFFIQVNNMLCKPEPLPESEIESIWNSALDFVTKMRNEVKIEDTEREDGTIDDENQGRSILELVNQNCLEFFLDQYHLPYAAVRINQYKETMPLSSRRFRNWLCKLYHDTTGKLIKAEDLTRVLNILKANAEFGGNTRELHIRVAINPTDPSSIYYDLTNSDWEVVKVDTEDGWTIEKLPPALFRRYSNHHSQVYPQTYLSNL